MRILHVTPAYYPATKLGGPIFSVYGLNNALAQIPQNELRVLTTDAAGPNPQSRLKVSVTEPVRYPAGYEVYFCRRLIGQEFAPQLLWRLVSLIRWAEIVHLTATYSFSTIPTLVLCRLFGRPVVWSPRGALLAAHEWPDARRRSLKKLWDQLCNFIIGKSGCTLHVTSEQERVASLARMPNALATVIRNGVEIPEALPPRTWCPGGTTRLLFIGRLDRKKGIENLFRALSLLQNQTFALEVCGAGQEQYVRALKSQSVFLGISNQVTFAGHVDGDDKLSAFMRADLCVVPSHSENFAMVVAESLAHGVPVVASKGTPWSTLVERNCGEWVDNSPECLAQAILHVCSKPLGDLGQNGRQWMKREYSWRAVAEEMHALYKDALNRG